MDQLDGPAGRTSSFYLKPWPVCIFEDFPFSLYIVAASESDEGLVYLQVIREVLTFVFCIFYFVFFNPLSKSQMTLLGLLIRITNFQVSPKLYTHYFMFSVSENGL